MATEKRLIDVNGAKRRIIAFATGCHSEVLPVDAVIMMLNQTPTVDAVEVVRCLICGQPVPRGKRKYCGPACADMAHQLQLSEREKQRRKK